MSDAPGMSALEAFARLRASQSLVIAQLGQSLDGRIATLSGESRGINGPGALDHLHRLRAQVDAVVVGVGTVIADNPQLTVRRGVVGPHPARVVVDPAGRSPREALCLTCDKARRIVLTAQDAPTFAAWPRGVEVVRLATREGQIAPREMLRALAERGLRRVLIEGGARTISHFIDEGCVDQLHLLVSPVIIGSGRAGLDLAPLPALEKALRPVTRMHDLGGGDVLFDCHLTPSEIRHDDL